MDYLLIGTYTKGKSEGIYVYEFDEATGKFRYLKNTRRVRNPSYLAVSADQRFVFSVNESGDKPEDFVSAFKFNNQNAELEFINKVSSGGIHPCYLSVDETTQHLFVANYSSGSLAVIDIDKTGRLSAPTRLFQFNGKSVHPERQKRSHLHATVISPGKQRLLVTDLGADKIYSYSTNGSEPLTLKLNNETCLEKGLGPRHLIFSKKGDFAYLSTELKAGVSVFSYKDQTLHEIQHISMTEDNFTGAVSGADLHLSNDGRFLYTSNRGDANELIVYAVHETSGTLQLVERVSSLGKTPRNFVIAPGDRFLIIANQDSNDCFIFSRDLVSGKLSYTGNKIEIESPVCLKFIQKLNS